jgi:hypothetical protein
LPLEQSITPGRVNWTGENPGILLKEREDGPFTAMALFFRIAWSPVGQGHVLLLYEHPERAESLPRSCNVIVSDNEPLAWFLKDTFIGKLPAFRDVPAFAAAEHVPARAVRASGDPMSHRYCEAVAADGIAVELVWEGLEPPMALELSPELTGTKEHTMFTVLVPARSASIMLNGRPLPGRPAKRVQAGIETTSAFLYFSETWILPPVDGR